MPERMGFDPSEEASKHAESERSLVFDASDGLDGIFRQLLELEDSGLTIPGSERTYSAKELGQNTMRVLKAANEATQAYDTELQKNLSRWVAEQHPGVSTIDVHDLPELQTLTRTGGFREAVAQAIQAMVDEPRRLRSGLWLPESTLELCEHFSDQEQ